MSFNFRNVLKSFVIGSCALIVIPFYIAVNSIPDVKEEINLMTYPIVVALYFGFMNVISLYLGYLLGLSLFQRLLLIWVISVMVVSIFIKVRGMYNWTDPNRWLLQYLMIAISHGIAFLVIIYGLETALTDNWAKL